MSRLPQASGNLLGFGRLLRDANFAIAPEQIVAFMQSVTLLGPRSMGDIRAAALAALAVTSDQRDEFEALYRAWFWGDAVVMARGEGDEDSRIKDDRGVDRAPDPDDVEPEKGGEFTSAAERLGVRQFAEDDLCLSRFTRELPSALPKRRSFRSVRALSRGRPDLRRSMRAIVSGDGDVARPVMAKRPHVQRKLLLIVDISGSMKAHTADHLKLAHALVQGAERAEVFTFGTRLTRVTSCLRVRNRARALDRVAMTADDWDGGTRIGPTLRAFLGVPRFAAFARGASVVLLTDGLERGSYTDMEVALKRLSASSLRLSLCTPLAADPRFRPRTAALQAAMPWLDDLVDGASIGSLTRFILSLAKAAPAAETIWREAK